MKKLIPILGILVFSLNLSACNTMKGLGKDVERGGEKVQDSAEGARKGSSGSSK
jgi:entericidin B